MQNQTKHYLLLTFKLKPLEPLPQAKNVSYVSFGKSQMGSKYCMYCINFKQQLICVANISFSLLLCTEYKCFRYNHLTVDICETQHKLQYTS